MSLKMIMKILKHACQEQLRGSKTAILCWKVTWWIWNPKYEICNNTSVFIDTIFDVCIILYYAQNISFVTMLCNYATNTMFRRHPNKGFLLSKYSVTEQLIQNRFHNNGRWALELSKNVSWVVVVPVAREKNRNLWAWQSAKLSFDSPWRNLWMSRKRMLIFLGTWFF